MNKLLLNLVFLLIVSGLNAQKLSVIDGVWGRGKIETIKLYKVADNATLVELASSKVADDGKFAFAFKPEEEGYYVVALTPTQPRYRHLFYFKPGDQLKFKYTTTGYELVGMDNTPENKEMEAWQKFMEPIDDKLHSYETRNSTYVDFFPLLEEKIADFDNYPKAQTSNAVFNQSFERFKEISLFDKALSFIHTMRSAHPQGEDFIDYYRNIDIADLSKDNSIISYPNGINLLMQACMFLLRINESIPDEEKKAKFADPEKFLLEETPQITNPVIKGEIALIFAAGKKTLQGFEESEAKYGKFITTDSQKNRWANMKKKLQTVDTGVPATDFAFPDVDGKKIALSDFKGKVVYVDLWATWCGPCKKEMPFLKELEKEFHGNDNIVFMGVSVDKSKDIEKWKEFLVKEELPGIQLFAGDEASEALDKPYKVRGIPRFILVGKDGNLIYEDAPRPSDPEIKIILNNAINK